MESKSKLSGQCGIKHLDPVWTKNLLSDMDILVFMIKDLLYIFLCINTTAHCCPILPSKIMIFTVLNLYYMKTTNTHIYIVWGSHFYNLGFFFSSEKVNHNIYVSQYVIWSITITIKNWQNFPCVGYIYKHLSVEQ